MSADRASNNYQGHEAEQTLDALFDSKIFFQGLF